MRDAVLKGAGLEVAESQGGGVEAGLPIWIQAKHIMPSLTVEGNHGRIKTGRDDASVRLIRSILWGRHTVDAGWRHRFIYAHCRDYKHDHHNDDGHHFEVRHNAHLLLCRKRAKAKRHRFPSCQAM